MVDAVDLVFGEVFVDELVQFFGRVQVVPERLFQDKPRPTFLRFVQAGPAELGDGVFESARGEGQVEDAVAG